MLTRSASVIRSNIAPASLKAGPGQLHLQLVESHPEQHCSGLIEGWMMVLLLHMGGLSSGATLLRPH